MLKSIKKSVSVLQTFSGLHFFLFNTAETSPQPSPALLCVLLAHITYHGLLLILQPLSSALCCHFSALSLLASSSILISLSWSCSWVLSTVPPPTSLSLSPCSGHLFQYYKVLCCEDLKTVWRKKNWNRFVFSMSLIWVAVSMSL